jgi:hypothetical protein
MRIFLLVPDILLPGEDVRGLEVRYKAMSRLLSGVTIWYYIWSAAAALNMAPVTKTMACVRSRFLVPVRISSGCGSQMTMRRRREGNWLPPSGVTALEMGPPKLR